MINKILPGSNSGLIISFKQLSMSENNDYKKALKSLALIVSKIPDYTNNRARLRWKYHPFLHVTTTYLFKANKADCDIFI